MGLASEIPSKVDFQFLLRTYIPGLIFATLSYPILSMLLSLLDIKVGNSLHIILSSGFLCGIILNLFDYTVYQIFEGRILWPGKCAEKRRKRWGKYILKINSEIEKKNNGNLSLSKRRELWYKLRAFPLDQKSRYFSFYPTKLGNIIHGYENYPDTRYGIDAVFYWYRIWLKLDENTKKDLEQNSSKADFGVYSSFVCFCISIMYLCWMIYDGIWKVLASSSSPGDVVLDRPSFALTLSIFILSLILGTFFYHISISLHRVYGEFFKAVFDLNKGIVKELCHGYSKEDFEKAQQVRRYFQYYRIKCPTCGKINGADLEKCEVCENPLPCFAKGFKT